MECVQYADDTSLYSHFSVKELDSSAVDMNETLVSITNWSQDSNLALNPAKTKCMLFSTPQMSSYHSLAERPIHLSVGDKLLERVHSTSINSVVFSKLFYGSAVWAGTHAERCCPYTN